MNNKIQVIFNADQFDISQIPINLDYIYTYQHQNLTQIIDNIQKHGDIFTNRYSQYQKISVNHKATSTNKQLISHEILQQFNFDKTQKFNKIPPTNLMIFCDNFQEKDKETGICQLICLKNILTQLSPQIIQRLMQQVYQFKIQTSCSYEQKLSILYTNQHGQLLIRYKFQNIRTDNLPIRYQQAIQILQSVIKKIKPFKYTLTRKECLYLSYGKFLIVDNQNESNNLHHIMIYRSTKIVGNYYHICQPIQKAKQLAEQYFEHLKKQLQIQNLPFNENTMHCDMIQFSTEFINVKKLQICIHDFLETIVRMYTLQDQMGYHLRQILGLPDKVNKILINLNKRKQFMLQFYQPKFILYEDQSTKKLEIKLYQIDCMPTINSYINSLLLNQVSCKQKNKPYKQSNYQKVIQTILQYFNNQSDIYFITNSQNQIPLLELLSKKTGRTFILINSNDLATHNSKLINRSTFKVITNVVLQLTQSQIRDLSQDVIQVLVYQTNCLNDLRSIFICQDTRLFGVLHQQQFYNFARKYLPNIQLEILRKNTAKTWNKNKIKQNKHYIENRCNYVIKYLYQKQNMRFGYDYTENQWDNHLSSQNLFVQEYIQPLKLPICNLINESVQMNVSNIVGTLLCYSNQFWGLGIHHHKHRNDGNLSNIGFFLGTRIVQKEETVTQNCFYFQSRQIQKYGEQQIKEYAIQKYKNLKTQNNNIKMYKANIRLLKNNWQSKYISPSGGSSKTEMYVANGFSQNHYMRQQLAKNLYKFNILSQNDICLNFFGGKYLYRSKQIFNQLCELCGATPLPMDNDFCLDDALKFMSFFKANTLMGTPSIILNFAKYCLSQPRIQIRKVLYSAQYLYESQKKIIKTAFPNAQFFSVFGSAETGVWAYTYGGMQNCFIYKFLSDIIKIQIENPNQQGIGKLLITNFIRTQTPIYRFQMGDFGQIINKNTFKLVPRPQLTMFRVVNCDFEIDQIHKILQKCFKWQIILKQEQLSIIELKLLMIRENEREMLEFLKNEFFKYINQEMKLQGQFHEIKLLCTILTDENQMIKVFPSGKHYYIIDQRV